MFCGLFKVQGYPQLCDAVLANGYIGHSFLNWKIELMALTSQHSVSISDLIFNSRSTMIGIQQTDTQWLLIWCYCYYSENITWPIFKGNKIVSLLEEETCACSLCHLSIPQHHPTAVRTWPLLRNHRELQRKHFLTKGKLLPKPYLLVIFLKNI